MSLINLVVQLLSHNVLRQFRNDCLSQESLPVFLVISCTFSCLSFVRPRDVFECWWNFLQGSSRELALSHRQQPSNYNNILVQFAGLQKFDFDHSKLVETSINKFVWMLIMIPVHSRKNKQGFCDNSSPFLGLLSSNGSPFCLVASFFIYLRCLYLLLWGLFSF